MPHKTRLALHHDADVLAAVREGRDMAVRAGFAGSDLAVIGTAISEVARNILVHAKQGEISLSIVERTGGRGVLIVAQDQGPGIADIEQAMQDGFSTGKSLGFGLPGARRLMDEFEIDSEIGKGTSVTMRKWTR